MNDNLPITRQKLNAIRDLLQDVFDETGVCVTEVHAEWFRSGPGMAVDADLKIISDFKCDAPEDKQ